ncbi:MAG TPA: hypothetical protein VNS33_01705 [Bradyrhizobium sp.]|nr:hypothetical protein [Bradyrhizobium sp.]
MSFSLDVVARLTSMQPDPGISRYRTIVHRYVRKFTTVALFRKADMMARRAKITHAASPMLK